MTTEIPKGWTPYAWRSELRRKAASCLAMHPARAAELDRWADQIREPDASIDQWVEDVIREEIKRESKNRNSGPGTETPRRNSAKPGIVATTTQTEPNQ